MEETTFLKTKNLMNNLDIKLPSTLSRIGRKYKKNIDYSFSVGEYKLKLKGTVKLFKGKLQSDDDQRDIRFELENEERVIKLSKEQWVVVKEILNKRMKY